MHYADGKMETIYEYSTKTEYKSVNPYSSQH